jgi:1-acyl-sn-glycerol-3-phosphate acyltransferase
VREPAAPVSPGGPLYWLIHRATQAAGLAFTRPRIVGAERVPRTGGLLVVSNHASIADPLVVMAACPRLLAFMAKEELFKGWYARLAARLTGGAFPVRRGQNDVRAVRTALELIRQGSAVMLFPEGTRHPEGLGRAHPGISYLATRSGCPVLPVAVIGTEVVRRVSDLRLHPSIEVRFGLPFTISADEGDASATADRIMRSIAALLPAGRRGVYAEEREAAHVR